MSKTTITALAIIAILLVGIIAFANTRTNTTKTKNSSSSSSSMTSMNMGSDMPGMGMSMGMSEQVTNEQSFLASMLPHHQEAVNSSELILAKSTNTTVKAFAQKVITDQTKEITDMKSWYKTWYGKEYVGSAATSMMGDMATMQGAALDTAYLNGMISHHQGAIDMAKKVLTFSNLHSETTTLANNIITNQSDEIVELRKILAKK